MSDEMPDSTKELLTAHHAAILRELDVMSRDVRGDLSDLRVDGAATRVKLDAHGSEDDRRFNRIDRGVAVLQWAYGVGLIVIGVIAAKMGWMP